MNSDKVEHRGIAAFQSVYGNSVQLFKGGKKVATIRTDRRQTVEDMRRLINEYLEGDKVK